jgi:hypothetical protein
MTWNEVAQPLEIFFRHEVVENIGFHSHRAPFRISLNQSLVDQGMRKWFGFSIKTWRLANAMSRCWLTITVSGPGGRSLCLRATAPLPRSLH